MKSFSVGQRLYISVVMVFLMFAVSFIVFQWNRERHYKIMLLETRLQNFNHQLNQSLGYMGGINDKSLTNYIKNSGIENLRLTLLDHTGKVIYDNVRKKCKSLPNHKDRPEIVEARKKGWGSTVERNSETVGQDFFYSATYFPQDSLFIRTALPYNHTLVNILEADQHFIWFALIAFTVLTLVLYRFVNRLGTNITKLKIFAARADHNESLETEDLAAFPADELGEIAEKIIKLYKRLQTTRREQSKLKRELTQNIAHELKTPVASIQGYLETIIDNPRIEDTMKQQFLERCYAQSARLSSLLQDISTLNRMEDAPDLQQFDVVDIVELVHNIQKETSLQLEERNMTFENLLPKELKIVGSKSLI